MFTRIFLYICRSCRITAMITFYRLVVIPFGSLVTTSAPPNELKMVTSELAGRVIVTLCFFLSTQIFDFALTGFAMICRHLYRNVPILKKDMQRICAHGRKNGESSSRKVLGYNVFICIENQ